MIHIRQSRAAHHTHLFDLTDRGLLLADGVFDTSLVIHGQIFLKEHHVQRLMHDAAALDIPIDRNELEAFIGEVLAPDVSGALRLTLTRGPAERGLTAAHTGPPTLIASISALDTARQFSPISLQTSSMTRNPNTVTAAHKTLSYTDNIVAARQATAAGFDDALLFNTTGNVACTTVANVFVCEADALITPPISQGAMPGVMRRWVLEHASQVGLQAMEEPLDVQRLRAADGIFLTNSLRLIAPISQVDDMYFDQSLPSDLTSLLRAQISHMERSTT